MKQLKVYFKIEDFDRMSKITKEQNITMSEFIRNATHATIVNPPKPQIKKSYKVTNPDLLFMLNKIGTNLNQVAKRLNSKNELESVAIFEMYEKIMCLKNED